MLNPEIEFHQVQFGNGLLLRFFDRSNRYFGDFHRAVVVIETYIQADKASLPDELTESARKMVNESISTQKLERMGVDTARLKTTLDTLVNDYLETQAGYIDRMEMPERLLRRHLLERKSYRRRDFKLISGKE